MIYSKRLCCLLLIAILSGFPVIAEEGSTREDAEGPVPYSPDEFPDWLLDLRRAEIVMLGSFPFTLLASSLGYGLIRYAVNEFQPEYRPWIFATPDAVELSTNEKLGVVLTAVGISSFIALLDFFLGLSEEDENE